MSFRDGKQTVFCRKLVTDKDVTLARERDKQMKPERTDKISTTKYKNKTKFTLETKYYYGITQNSANLIPYF